MSRLYDVSVVIAQYNPSYDLVIKTISSIINQKKVNIEIIIADDGSSKDFFIETEEYFKSHMFQSYKFTKCETNQGTCLNVKKAVEAANGEYVKLISPGDYLYDEDTLHEWYCYCKDNSILVSYGTAVYHQLIDNEIKIIERKTTRPALNYLYKLDNKNIDGMIIDNIVLCDCILGAAYLCKKDILEKYLNEICGKIRFCEDFSYRLMLLDGERITWFNKPVVYYSYGDGVSNKKDKNGKSLLYSDEIAFDKILSERSMALEISQKVQKFINKKNSNTTRNRILSFVIFPKALYYRVLRLIMMWLGLTKSECNISKKYVELIQSERGKVNNAGD